MEHSLGASIVVVPSMIGGIGEPPLSIEMHAESELFRPRRDEDLAPACHRPLTVVQECVGRRGEEAACHPSIIGGKRKPS